MPRFPVTAALVSALLLTGCAESAGPLGPGAPAAPEAPAAPDAPAEPSGPSGSAADFDRVQAKADMDAFVRSLESPTNATLQTGFREIDELVQGGGLPEGLTGVTFEFDVAAGKYKQSAEAGAPADGVRFVLYGVSPSHEFLPSLDEVGHVDLVDQDSGERRQVRLQASLIGTTVADYVSWAEGDEIRGSYGFTGWVILAGHRVEFDLAGSSRPSGSGMRDSLDARIVLDDRDYLVDGSLMVEGNGTTELSSFAVDYRSRGGEAEIEGTADGTTTTRSVALNGEAYATSEQPAGMAPAFLGVPPHVVTAEEAAFFADLEDLNAISYAMARWTAKPVRRLIALSVLVAARAESPSGGSAGGRTSSALGR